MKMNKSISTGLPYARKKAYEYQGTKFEADIKDGDIVKILDGGQKVTGQFGEQDVFKIRTRNGDKMMALNKVTVNNLIEAFGDESENWVDQDVKVWVIKAMVSGKMSLVSYLSHPDAEMDDEGRFSTKGGGVELESVDYDAGEADEEDVPDFDDIGKKA